MSSKSNAYLYGFLSDFILGNARFLWVPDAETETQRETVTLCLGMHKFLNHISEQLRVVDGGPWLLTLENSSS